MENTTSGFLHLVAYGQAHLNTGAPEGPAAAAASISGGLPRSGGPKIRLRVGRAPLDDDGSMA